MYKLALTLAACVLVTACSDKMAPMKPFMACSIAAGVLNQDTAARTALAKSMIVRQSKGITVTPNDAAKLHNEIREEWLEKGGKANDDQIAYLVKVFNTPECLAITESQPLKLADVDVSKIAPPKNPAK